MSQTVSESLFLGLVVVSLCVWAQMGSRAIHERRLPIPYRMRRRGIRHPLVIWLAVSWIVFQTICVVAGAFMDLPVEATLSGVQSSCITNAVIFTLFLFLVAQTSEHSLRDLGLDFTPAWADVVYGSMGFLASVLPVTAVLICLNQLGVLTPTEQHSFLLLLQKNPGPETILWIELAVVIAAPLTEELLFRVILQSWLETWMRGSWAILITAICFSVVHGWPNAVAIFPLALILGYVYHRRHSAAAVIVLHAFFNASNLVRALLTPWTDGELPEPVSMLWLQ